MVEGRYDAMVTKLSRELLAVVKDSFAATTAADGNFAGKKIYFDDATTAPSITSDTVEEIYFEEVDNQTIPLEFYLSLKVQWIAGYNNFSYGGDAYWSQGHEDEFIRYNYILKNSPIANGGKEAWKKAYVLIGLNYTEDLSQHFDTDEEAIAWINKLKELSNKTFETIEYKN